MPPIRKIIFLLFLTCIGTGSLVAQCSVSLGNNISICQNATGIITAVPTGGTVTTYAWSNASIANPFTIPTTTVAITTYTVTATFTGGCTATASISVAVNSIPTASISPATAT